MRSARAVSDCGAQAIGGVVGEGERFLFSGEAAGSLE